jgi:hypothetical protein
MKKFCADGPSVGGLCLAGITRVFWPKGLLWHVRIAQASPRYGCLSAQGPDIGTGSDALDNFKVVPRSSKLCQRSPSDYALVDASAAFVEVRKPGIEQKGFRPELLLAAERPISLNENDHCTFSPSALILTL